MTAVNHARAVRGIHHITAVSSSPQQTVRFYTELLALRMVKLTVNFDDPSTFHLYFGDRTGTPGTILTFFAFPLAARGRPGTGQVTAIAFRVPPESLRFWAQRFSRHGIDFVGPFKRFDTDVISFADADGLPLELVANATRRADWTSREVSKENAIVEFDGATLSVSDYEASAQLLQQSLGMRPLAAEEYRFRFRAESKEGHGDNGSGPAAQNIDILYRPNADEGVPGVGTVHHIAWRCGDNEQDAWREDLTNAGLNVTPIIDRKYFHSIYFREPGGILFEIATDEPGFCVDEAVTELGSSLKLPEWLESRRLQIERSLPNLADIPQALI